MNSIETVLNYLACKNITLRLRYHKLDLFYSFLLVTILEQVLCSGIQVL